MSILSDARQLTEHGIFNARVKIYVKQFKTNGKGGSEYVGDKLETVNIHINLKLLGNEMGTKAVRSAGGVSRALGGII